MNGENSTTEQQIEVSSAKWYVQCGENDVRGPCDTDILKSLFKSSFIDGLTNVWCEGMESWQSISSLDELKGVLTDVNDEVENEDVIQSPREQTDTTDLVRESEESVECVDEVRKRKREKKKQYLKRKKMRIESGQWIDSAKNFSVYVSGLPMDTTLKEVADVFKRAGVIKIDPLTTLPKIKLYTDERGNFKGDARVTFVNKESIDFAIRYLNNYYFREDCLIHVEQARYEPHKYQNNAPPVTNPEMRKKYLAAKYEQDRLQSWSDDIDDGTGRRIVIAKPMFSMEEAETYEADSPFYKELREEIVAEVNKYVEVEKVTPIARHPQGVVCFKFKTSSDAELFISKFNNRMFDGRQLEVYFFDGKTDLQAQTIPVKSRKVEKLEEILKDKEEDIPKCDWIDEQSSDDEFEVRTE